MKLQPVWPAAYLLRKKHLEGFLRTLDAPHYLHVHAAQLLVEAWHGGFWRAVRCMVTQHVRAGCRWRLMSLQRELHRFGFHFKTYDSDACWICEGEAIDRAMEEER